VRLARRALLRGGGALAIGAALPLPFLFRRSAVAAGFGALVPDPRGVLDLPAAFTYRVLERRGDPMSDGYRVPASPDAMACFAGPGNTLVLMRNHEVGLNDPGAGPYRPGQLPPPLAYDPAGHGGVTRLVLDATTLARVSSNLVLAGTSRNCAGGVSPWGWLSCEEDFSATHGYVFVCPTDAATVQPPRRIVGYGHFNHEAATVDPATSICYLTEDRPDSCLYRFLPVGAARPFEGRLQALRVVGRDRFVTGGSGLVVGQVLDVDWVDVADPDPATDAIRSAAQARGAALFARGEGLWHHQGSVYFCATIGGPAAAGQIFQLIPGGPQTGGRLLLVAQSASPATLDMPDNITVAPWGGLFMAEDGGGGPNHIRGLDAGGAVYDFARGPSSGSEFAGVCFAPGGQVMFVNIQRDGLTLAITGPFTLPRSPSEVIAR
jgi:secreted PhoX family phosphatase